MSKCSCSVMSTETYLQCIARADRIGQDSTHVTVIHLQGSELEKRMYEGVLYEEYKNQLRELYGTDTLFIPNF